MINLPPEYIENLSQPEPGWSKLCQYCLNKQKDFISRTTFCAELVESEEGKTSIVINPNLKLFYNKKLPYSRGRNDIIITCDCYEPIPPNNDKYNYKEVKIGKKTIKIEKRR